MAAPTPTSARPAPRRARLVLVLALVALALLAGCSTIGSLTGLTEDLEDEGFTRVRPNIDQSDPSTLVVAADPPDDTTIEEAQTQAAEIVWTRFPRRIGGLRVTIDGEGREWTYAELEDELGPRPDGLDSQGDLGDEVNRIAVFGVIGILLAGVLGIGLVGLVVLLVVRSNRRSAASGPRPLPRPWMPPGVPGGGTQAGTPVPPPGGWASASAPPGPPTSPAAPPAGPGPSRPEEPMVPSGPPAPAGRRRRDPDARRLGRRPRGPVADQAHTPPGWG